MENELYVTFTFAEFVRALREEGVPKCLSYFFLYEDDGKNDKILVGKKIIAACAVGKVAIKLGFNPLRISDENESGILSTIESWSDNEDMDFDEVADLIEKAPWYDPEMVWEAEKANFDGML